MAIQEDLYGLFSTLILASEVESLVVEEQGEVGFASGCQKLSSDQPPYSRRPGFYLRLLLYTDDDTMRSTR